MKVLIIEDEKPAADKLLNFISMYDATVEIQGIIGSVQQAVEWLIKAEFLPDLIFMDIQLADGLCFEIFDQVSVKKPIIFTTAFNQYALEAFKQNSIDYLLKPISYEAFYQSMKKLESFGDHLPDKMSGLGQLKNVFSKPEQAFKQRFMVKVGDHLRSVIVSDIAIFYSEGRSVTLLTKESKQYIVDYKMEQLETMLSPAHFFRLSRSFIVNISYIAETFVYSNSRLKVKLSLPFEEEIIVSREKVKAFKEWFDGKHD
jgi:two-component system, LytTR family, response regulator